MDTHQRLQLTLALGLAGAMAPGPVSALDYCISCAGPEAHYNCRLDLPGANPRDLRLQLLCISQIATTGGHETCAVDSPQPTSCPGTLKVVAAPDEIMVAPPAQAPKTAATSEGAAPPKAAGKAPAETVVPKDPKPPKTVQEVVEKSAAATGETLEQAGGAAKGAAKSAGGMLQNAGSAVSNAAKKTWNCVTSLFGNC